MKGMMTMKADINISYHHK